MAVAPPRARQKAAERNQPRVSSEELTASLEDKRSYGRDVSDPQNFLSNEEALAGRKIYEDFSCTCKTAVTGGEVYDGKKSPFERLNANLQSTPFDRTTSETDPCRSAAHGNHERRRSGLVSGLLRVLGRPNSVSPKPRSAKQSTSWLRRGLSPSNPDEAPGSSISAIRT